MASIDGGNDKLVIGNVEMLRNGLVGGKTEKTRPDTRLPKSRAGGQGPYLRSLDHLGRSSEVQK